MLATGGIHPLVLRQRKVIMARRKPARTGLMVPLALVMLFLTGFAYGLHLIDLRYSQVPALAPPAAEEPETPFSEYLTEGFRFFFGIPAAQAAEFDAGRYKAQPAERTVTVETAPGGTVTVVLRYKNLGSAVWRPSGRGFISVYTVQPRYHRGVFRHSSWLSSVQPARLDQPEVKRGETGTVTITAQAPSKVGTFSEWVQLASEDTAWIWGGHVKIVMNVKNKLGPGPSLNMVSDAAPAVVEPVEVAAPLQGSLVYRTAERLEGPGGLRISPRLVVKNGGGVPWKRWGLKLVSAVDAAGNDIVAADDAWASPEFPFLKDELVLPNQNADFLFPLTLPRRRGDYRLKFLLVADGASLDAVPIDYPVTVLSDGPPAAKAPGGEPAPPTASPEALREEESLTGDPFIRVGLYTTDHEEIIGSDGAFEARSLDGSVLGRFAAGARARFRYDAPARLYRVEGDSVTASSLLPIRFVQTGGAEVFTLHSHEDRPSWNLSVNYNRYRGTIELRKNDRNDYVWVIDELPMEQYLKGMKETSNASPLEFQKALVVAARSYANWHLTHPGKHWHFTVDATYDQVYKGYVAEMQIPKLTVAADATRGQIVTYGGDPVVTPYFSWSDGRTRAWTEVWGGAAKPWLVSVAAPYDAAAGRTLFGHGVGLSAWDAIGRANAGATYDTILSYYYSGTSLKKAY
jgi:hypothetical protein